MMKATTQKDFEEAERIETRLAGITAKLEVMAAAFQPNGGIPSPEIVEAALQSLADELQEVHNAFTQLWEVEPPKE